MRRYQHNDNLMWSQMVVFLLPVFERFCFWGFSTTCTLLDVGLHSTSSVSGTTLTQCLANACCIGPALSECWASISCRVVTRRTQNMCITLVQRRPTSSTLVQHCTNVIQMFCVYGHVGIPWHTAGFFGRRHSAFHPVLKTLGETRRCRLGF